jgi:protein-S-isoprenylcysteine O-methyltransferase Ste14
MPVTREEKHGEKAWQDCYRYRLLMSVFAGIMIVNMFLWILFPIDELTLVVFPNHIFSIIIGIGILIPCSIILYFALKHGGKEHMKPEKETSLHGGIYNIIRHPGIWGEMPMYIAIGFIINSLFIVIWVTLFVIIFTPIYIYFEEKDLIKRFGKSYLEYREKTGMLIPKFWSKKS